MIKVLSFPNLFKIKTAMEHHHDMVAFKEMDDYYVDGVELKKVKEHSTLFHLGRTKYNKG